jgi:pimeloyl-ACP methyl ester carboxylesterase
MVSDLEAMTSPQRHWIFLRGLARNSDHWGPFKVAFQSHFPQDKIELLDLRGNGSLAHSPSYASIADNVRDLRARSHFLQEGRKVSLLSISMGAMIASEWARRHSDEVQELVLINTSERGSSKFWERLRPFSYPRLAKILLHQETSPEIELDILKITSHLADKEKWSKIFAKSPSTTRMNFAKQIFAASRYEFPRHKPKTDVLILNSAKDRLVHPSCSENIAHLWHLRVHTHPTAGHDLPLDAPDWICDEIARWHSLA